MHLGPRPRRDAGGAGRLSDRCACYQTIGTSERFLPFCVEENLKRRAE